MLHRLYRAIVPLLLWLAWLLPASAQINPPAWYTGYINVPAAATATTNIPNPTPYNLTNLNIIAAGNITTWNVALPAIPFDGQIITITPGLSTVTTLNVTAPPGVGLPSSTFGAYQFQSNQNAWIYIQATGGGAGNTYTAGNGLSVNDANVFSLNTPVSFPNGGTGLSVLGTSLQCLVTNALVTGMTWTNCGATSVNNVTATNTTLTIFPTSGAVLASLNLANVNFWTNGIGSKAFNANVVPNVTDNVQVQHNCLDQAIGNLNLSPQFSNMSCVELEQTTLNMDSMYGVHTQAKTTTPALIEQSTYMASGQRIQESHQVNCYGGLSDCAASTTTLFFASVPIAGDEGAGFTDVDLLSQFQGIQLSTITAVGPSSTCNATNNNLVSASAAQQVIPITISSGTCNVGDWVIFGQDVPVSQGRDNKAVAQITTVGAGTITAQVRGNFLAGNTITPATVLTLHYLSFPGQGRLLVDISQTPYSTGTVTTLNTTNAVVGAGGASWSANMIGGNSTNIGCISFANDTWTGNPYFSPASPLRSYYQILAVQDATDLTIYSNSTAANANYTGIAGAGEAYAIYPCAQVMYLGNTAGVLSNQIILEASTTTWTVGDTVEFAQGAFPTVEGFQYQVQGFTPGGDWEAFWDLVNIGSTQWKTVLSAVGRQPVGHLENPAWNTGINFNNMNYGISLGADIEIAAVHLAGAGLCAATANVCGRVEWGTGANYIQPNASNGGTDMQMAFSTTGLLQFISAGVTGGEIPGSVDLMTFGGMSGNTPVNFSLLGACNAAMHGRRAEVLANTGTFGAVPTTNGTFQVGVHCGSANQWAVSTPP